MSSRQVVKVEHKVSVAAFTSRDEKCVGEGREEDTTEERCEGERERRSMLTHTPSQSLSTIITCQYWSLCTHRALWRQCFRQNNSCT